MFQNVMIALDCYLFVVAVALQIFYRELKWIDAHPEENARIAQAHRDFKEGR